MDFIDLLKQFATRVSKLQGQVQTEEATKTALIMPFFQTVLGYDVFNPDEFVPEFTADVGIKKGEKVDYAIFFDGSPRILIEAKWCGQPLDKHDSQLFRYFATTTAKIGILTNGIIYKFYTDLEEQNKMDMKPFLEFDLLNIKEPIVPELKKFSKPSFDVEEIINSASELRYSNEIRKYFEEQLKEPSDDFVRFMLTNIYDGVKTQSVIDRFKPTVKSTLNNYINELMNDKITAALKKTEKIIETESDKTEPAIIKEPERVLTTQEELEAYGIVKGMLCSVANPEKITFKDTERYFVILYDGKVTKWICRLYLDGKKKTLVIPASVEPPYDKQTRYSFTSINNLYSLRENLIASVMRFIEKDEPDTD